MPRQVQYLFKRQKKVINFSYDKYRDIYEAVAAEEGIDLTGFLAMEQQVINSARDKSAIKDFRQKEFQRMGFGKIEFLKEKE